MRLRFKMAHGNAPAVRGYHLRAATRLTRLAARCERKASTALADGEVNRHCGYLRLAGVATDSAARHLLAAADTLYIPPVLTGLTTAV